MRRILTLAAVATCFALPLANVALGGKPHKPKSEHHDTVIGSVSASSITIKEDKTEKTYTISPLTEITVNGQKGTAADLKSGMLVSITMTDATRLSRIAATTKP